MSVLSEFYIAKPQDALRYDVDPNLPDSERAEFRGLTYAQVANLWAILQNTETTPELEETFESILVVDGGERLINRFPPEFVAALAALDAPNALVAAEKWIQDGELTYSSCETADILPVIEALSRLARSAQQSGKSLYLWMSL